MWSTVKYMDYEIKNNTFYMATQIDLFYLKLI